MQNPGIQKIDRLVIGKNPPISGLVLFKPVLFKGQPCYSLASSARRCKLKLQIQAPNSISKNRLFSHASKHNKNAS